MRLTASVLFVLLSLCAATLCSAQGMPFKKSVMDSIKARDFKFRVTFGMNLSQDGGSSFSTNSNIGLLYVTKKNDFHLDASRYIDRYNKYSSANRFFVMGYVGLGSHVAEQNSVQQRAVYPEPFALYSFDANRGINARVQLGTNLAIGFKPTRNFRAKAGAGLFVERQNWQMIKHDKMIEVLEMPEEIQKLIFDTVGISQSGTLTKNNMYLNLYTNLAATWNQRLNLNGFVAIQQPFFPPYKGLPQIPQFPTVTRRYPRITTDLQVSFQVWRKIYMITQFYLQYDKGQLPLYVPNFVYSLSEGFEINF